MLQFPKYHSKIASAGIALLVAGAAILVLSLVVLVLSTPGDLRAQEDSTAPVVISFDFTPKIVNPSSAPVTVTCIINASDIGSGVEVAGCVFQSPSGRHKAQCSSEHPSSGTALSGTWACQARIKQYVEQGAWTLSHIFVVDEVDNRTRLTPSDLPGGFPPDLSVSYTAVTGGAGGSGGAGGAGGTGGALPDTCDTSVVTAYSVTGTGVTVWSADQVETATTTLVTLDYYMRTTATFSDAGLGIAGVPTASWAEHSVSVKFNANGTINAKTSVSAPYTDNVGYACDDGAGSTTTSCPTYLANTWYHFVITADISTQTYDVDYGVCPGSLTRLATGFAFRAPATQLDRHVTWSINAGATLDVGNAMWLTGPCTSTTCAAAPLWECGSKPSGCGPVLDCDATNGGTCAARNAAALPTDVCNAGACCTPLTLAQACTTTGYGCGEWDDGCGGFVDCGVCPSGNYCSVGVCTSIPVGGAPYSHVVASDIGVTIGVGVPGVGSGVVPTALYTGSTTITVPNTLIENVVVNGCMDIQAANVTMRNVIINCNSYYPIYIYGGNNFLIENSHVNCTSYSKNIRTGGTSTGITIRKNELQGCNDFFYIDGNVDNMLIEDNYMHSLTGTPSAHADGFQIGEAYTTTGLITIRGNYIWKNNPNIGTTDILFATNSSNNTIIMENNLFRLWGFYTLRNSGQNSPLTVRNNIFHQEFKAALSGPGKPSHAIRHWEGNPATSLFECNRYEDGTFVEQAYTLDVGGRLTYDVTGCVTYP